MKHATKNFKFIKCEDLHQKKTLTVVAIKHSIGIGSSRSLFPGPSLMHDENLAEYLSANEPWRVPVKKWVLIEEMIAGCINSCFLFGFPP